MSFKTNGGLIVWKEGNIDGLLRNFTNGRLKKLFFSDIAQAIDNRPLQAEAPFFPGLLAPPLLIYAELLASGNDRNIETGKLIYEKYLAQLVA